MQLFGRREALRGIAAAASLTALSRSAALAEDRHEHDQEPRNGLELKAPPALTADHEELHEALVRATQAGGKTGEAAKEVARVLHPHFVREEELAMPPLGLLTDLANGAVRPEMARAVELTDQLQKEMPRMLAEHQDIVKALKALAKVAEQENQPEAAKLAAHIQHHAEVEEQVLYPAALLVGEFLKLKLGM